jgi:hypothetical protein
MPPDLAEFKCSDAVSAMWTDDNGKTVEMRLHRAQKILGEAATTAGGNTPLVGKIEAVQLLLAQCMERLTRSGLVCSPIAVVCAFGYAASGFCTLLWKLSIACVN